MDLVTAPREMSCWRCANLRIRECPSQCRAGVPENDKSSNFNYGDDFILQFAAFTLAAPLTFGNEPRSSLTLEPSVAGTRTSRWVRKLASSAKRQPLTFRAEFFNISIGTSTRHLRIRLCLNSPFVPVAVPFPTVKQNAMVLCLRIRCYFQLVRTANHSIWSKDCVLISGALPGKQNWAELYPLL